MLHVNGGVGDLSYANNSFLQQEIISMISSVAEEAVTDFYNQTFPTALSIADLGCSSGSNTLMVVSNLIKRVEEIRREKPPLEYQIFFNDLHGNDFNAIFRSLPSFLETLKTQGGADLGPCFFNGVPGSFYTRLFPSKSVHFFHSSSSLHWLSQVPEGIENNKGNIFMDSTSPKSVLEAYRRQFQEDFSMFLKCRAEELVMDGRMVLTMLGRIVEDPPDNKYYYVWNLLGLALNNMVAEGIVEEEKVDSFNIPSYMPSLSELQVEVLNEGSFTINRFEISRIDWNIYNNRSNPSNMSNDIGYDFTKSVRSVLEALLISHFGGGAVIEELFHRYKKIVAERMSREKLEIVNLTISLTKIK